MRGRVAIVQMASIMPDIKKEKKYVHHHRVDE